MRCLSSFFFLRNSQFCPLSMPLSTYYTLSQMYIITHKVCYSGYSSLKVLEPCWIVEKGAITCKTDESWPDKSLGTSNFATKPLAISYAQLQFFWPSSLASFKYQSFVSNSCIVRIVSNRFKICVSLHAYIQDALHYPIWLFYSSIISNILSLRILTIQLQ